MTHLQKLKAIQDVENQHNIQKELLLEQITKINTLYSECNGSFLEKLSEFITEYANNNNIDFSRLILKQQITKENENRRKIKMGQLYDEISSELAIKNEENNRISSIVSNISRTQEAI